jgi:hypothetical protein
LFKPLSFWHLVTAAQADSYLKFGNIVLKWKSLSREEACLIFQFSVYAAENMRHGHCLEYSEKATTFNVRIKGAHHSSWEVEARESQVWSQSELHHESLPQKKLIKGNQKVHSKLSWVSIKFTSRS